jgi:hypothetical protein
MGELKASKNEHPQHPPDQKKRDDATRDMNNPIASRLRFAEIEHAAMVAGPLRQPTVVPLVSPNLKCMLERIDGGRIVLEPELAVTQRIVGHDVAWIRCCNLAEQLDGRWTIVNLEAAAVCRFSSPVSWSPACGKPLAGS